MTLDSNAIKTTSRARVAHRRLEGKRPTGLPLENRRLSQQQIDPYLQDTKHTPRNHNWRYIRLDPLEISRARKINLNLQGDKTMPR